MTEPGVDQQQFTTATPQSVPVAVVIKPSGPPPVITFPTGSEPPLAGIANGTLLVEYTP
jgi:hypothetical protein